MKNLGVRLAILLALCVLSIGSASKRPRITPPQRMKVGDPPIQTPGWSHCVTDVKANGAWNGLRSPSYPKLPPTSMQCSWIIEAPIGWRVLVTFRDLHLTPAVLQRDGTKSCQFSYVDIIDMTAQKSQGKFCGNQPPGDYVSLGPVLRIDLQGDKSKTSRRGFVIRYTITKDTPGLRAQRKIKSPSDSTSGKVNFNDFKSTQRRMINNAGSQGPLKRKYKVPKRLIYGSETTTPKPQTTTDPNGGWLGDGKLAPIKPPKKGSKGKARPKPPPPGSRIQAVNQRNQRRPNSNQNPSEPQSRNNAGNRIQYVAPQQSDGRQVGDGEQTAEPIEPVRIYGQNLQPRNSENKQKKDDKKRPTNNYVVVSEDEGITTEKLIIIIVGVMACILLLLGIFLLKKFCFDKKKKEEKKEEETEENPYCVDHETSLPGISRAGSFRSAASIYEHTSKSRHTSVAPTSHRGTMSRNALTNGEMTRHQSLVAQHEALYRNHIEMMKRGASSEGLQRRPSLGGRSNVNRPLPPIPGEKRSSRSNDADEDYFSGSDVKDKGTTMRRELSEWEIQEEKRNKKKNRYVLRN